MQLLGSHQMETFHSCYFNILQASFKVSQSPGTFQLHPGEAGGFRLCLWVDTGLAYRKKESTRETEVGLGSGLSGWCWRKGPEPDLSTPVTAGSEQ